MSYDAADDTPAMGAIRREWKAMAGARAGYQRVHEATPIPDREYGKYVERREASSRRSDSLLDDFLQLAWARDWHLHAADGLE